MQSSKATSRGEELVLQITGWLTSPVFPNEGDKTHRAKVLNLALINVLVLIPVLIISNFLGGKTPVAVIVVDALAIILCLILFYWSRRGRIRLASFGLMALGFIGITAAIANLGTIRVPSTAMYLLLIITAGLLFDLRGMIVTTAISSLLVGGLMLAETMGLLPAPNYSITITQWITYTAIFGWGGSLTFSALQSMNNALAHADNELAERRLAEEELTKHRDHLEELVKEATTGLSEKNFMLSEEITERKLAEEALRAERDLAERYLNIAEVIIVALDTHARITLLNRKGNQVLGYEEGELIGKDWIHTCLRPQDHQQVHEVNRKINSGEIKAFEYYESYILTKKGEERFIAWHTTILQDEKGCIIGTLSSGEDITERKLAEDALRKSEQEKGAILDGLKNVSVEYLDPQMHIIWLNNAVRKHLGLSEDEIKGKRCFEVIQGLESSCPGCTALKALQTAQSQEGELITPDGNVWISHSNLIKGANGNVTGVVHVAVNISDRKRAEKALQESENMYRAIFENTGTAAVIIEDNTTISLANSEFERLSGYSKDEVEGKISWTEFVLKEDFERMMQQHELRRTDPNLALNSYEFRAINKNGNVMDMLLRVGAIPGTKKSIASLMDITERKEAEEKLRASHQILDGIINTIPVRVFWKDKDLVYLGCNTIFAQDSGFADPKDIVGKDDFQMAWRDQAELYRADDLQVIESGLPKLLIEEPQTTPDGNTIVLLTSKIPLRGSEGEIIGVLGTYLDITERKQAEEALRDSESKLAAIIEFLPDATFVIDNDKRVIAWNRAIEEMTGVNKDNIIGKGDYAYTIPFYGERRSHLLDLIDLNDNDLASKYQYVQRKGNTLYAETFTPALYGGKGAYVWATGAPLFDNKGNRIGAIESIRDITEYRRAERTLQEQLNFLQQLIDSIPSPIFYKDTKGVYLGCNIAFEAITGYCKDKIVGHTVYELYPKDLADIYYEADNKLFQDPGEQMYEASMVHADGSRHDVMFSKATYFDTEGRLAGLVGVILDITERKHMENALLESERRLTDIINFLPDATVVIDTEGKVIAWNKAIEAMTGIKAWDILGKGDCEYSLPFYGEKRPLLIDLVLKPQSEFEKRYSDLKWVDGTLVGYAFTPNLKRVGAYVWGVASPIYDSQGKIVGAIESVKDITEQKKMEKDLQESKDYLNKIINSIGDPLFVKDRQHRMTLVNDAVCKLFGRPREEILGRTPYDLFPSKEMAEISWKKDEEAFRTGVEITNEETNTFAPDVTLTVLVKKTPYTDNAGNQFLIGIARDITDRKQAEDRIIASLQEKEVLLKEVHHRVKNNLQVISALLKLQSSYLTDEDIIKIFRDSQNRIKSMALIHENLYRSKDLGKVNFSEYIKHLISHLSQSYGDLASKINFKVNSDNVFLNINTAIPCGMIINELVSNSLKHAFPDGKKGEICIDLSSEDDGFKLIISDNGIGIKGDLNIKDSKTLGFRLINTLVKQIDGNMSLDTINGTRCEIHFKGLK